MVPPITDFDSVFPKPGDLASPLDVFNDDNMKKQMIEEVGSIKKQLGRVVAEQNNAKGKAGPASQSAPTGLDRSTELEID